MIFPYFILRLIQSILAINIFDCKHLAVTYQLLAISYSSPMLFFYQNLTVFRYGGNT